VADATWSSQGGVLTTNLYGGLLGAAKAAARPRSVGHSLRHEQETVTGQCPVAAGR